MDQVISCALLTTTAATLVFQIVGLRWTDRLRVHTFGHLWYERRMLVEAMCRIRWFSAGLASPADGSAVYMMHMEYFRTSMDNPLFDPITEIASG